MRYAQIRKMDIANGPGIRVSIFVQGCHFHCKGCFNSETWDFSGGKEFTDNVLELLLNLCNSDHISGLSILGGEPLNPANISEVKRICTEFNKRFPNKDIWLWTGYEFDQIKNDEIYSLVDVLVCGPFIEAQKDLSLKYCGSRNQQVIKTNRRKIV